MRPRRYSYVKLKHHSESSTLQQAEHARPCQKQHRKQGVATKTKQIKTIHSLLVHKQHVLQQPDRLSLLQQASGQPWQPYVVFSAAGDDTANHTV
jgi:uncharacterized protein YfaQ (DUF2300 family)